MPRGGSRPGTGRPPIPTEQKRLQMSISISPETKRIIGEIRRSGVNIGQLIDQLVHDYFANH